ncbi:uncharacterized protein [Glycine max]|uniref:uncharacterized protein n=1 Tax=Glycine max TaxID=3847 RepID=UPI0003DEC5F1|nr:uncharacterized protein LOC102659663 [Glycine max]|eukprot:XP_006599975.1 uncharacterized protein LOC102659663 [Glycine max]
MIIKRAIPEVFRDTVSDDITSAKDFLAEIEKRFAKSDKAETSTLLQNLISMKSQGKGNVRGFIMGMSNIASKLRALKLELSEDLLIHLVVISLPSQFSQLRSIVKEKWSLNELMERLKQKVLMLYDGSGEQRPGPFAKYLEKCGIIPQYTMPGLPSMNGVAER